jgi:L-malate glycosyltransferase
VPASKNCRLLYLVGGLSAGGLERQLCFLLQGIDRELYRPELVVWNFRNDDMFVPSVEKLRVPLHSFSNGMSANRKLMMFRRLVKEMKPQVVHSYCFYTNFAAWWATIGTDTIPIGGLQSDFTSEKRLTGILLGRLSARWPRTQISNNVTAAENARYCRGPFTPRKIFIVRNGIDLVQFGKVPPPTNGQVRLVGIGSLFQYKRWERLLRAALVLRKRRLDFIVQIAGNGPLRESLERQTRELGLADTVIFSGHIDDIPSLLGNSTFVVHTSDLEGCPNAVLEAMAAGRAVVATDAGDVPSIVDDGQTGFVVRSGDDARLVERLATLISNRELCRQMGEAGRVKAEREFGLDRLVSETLAAYRAAGWRDS